MSPTAHHTDLTPSVIVGGIVDQLRTVSQSHTNRGFGLCTREIDIRRIGEIAFKDVTHHVDHTGGDLFLRQCEEQFRIHNGEDRADVLASRA